MKTFRSFTSAIPLTEKTVVLTDGKAGFANTVEDKVAMAKGAKKRALYVAWPGAIETHVFKVTGADVLKALTPTEPFKVGDLVRVVVQYTTGPLPGTLGVIRTLDSPSGRNIGVEWVGFKGHGGVKGARRDRSGWFVPANTIEAA